MQTPTTTLTGGPHTRLQRTHARTHARAAEDVLLVSVAESPGGLTARYVIVLLFQAISRTN